MNNPGSILGIMCMPTVIKEVPKGARGVHESCVRSYQILAKVKWLLEKKTDPEVITELVGIMEEQPDRIERDDFTRGLEAALNIFSANGCFSDYPISVDLKGLAIDSALEEIQKSHD